ncbi:MAG: ABC transporter permease subunit [Chloroflexaceae bacterium]|nr:ABC transporter permease subunit [Chloroflexaceae bacterium]
MIHLVQAEWLKLTRRPMTWILLGLFLVLLAFNSLGWFLFVALHDGTFTGGTTRIQILDDVQVNQLRLQLRFPGVFGDVLGYVNSIGGVLAMVLAAAAVGSEYGWGTLRLHLARHPRRGRYLIGKIITLLLVILAGMVIALLIGSLLGLLLGSILGNVGSITPGDLLLLLPGILRALYVILPYILFTIAITIIGRSVLAGVAGGVLFLVLDGGAGALAFVPNLGIPLLTFIYYLFLQPNINALIILHRSSYGMDASAITGLSTEGLPPPWQAALMIALYSGIFFCLCLPLIHPARCGRGRVGYACPFAQYAILISARYIQSIAH